MKRSLIMKIVPSLLSLSCIFSGNSKTTASFPTNANPYTINKKSSNNLLAPLLISGGVLTFMVGCLIYTYLNKKNKDKNDAKKNYEFFVRQDQNDESQDGDDNNKDENKNDDNNSLLGDSENGDDNFNYYDNNNNDDDPKYTIKKNENGEFYIAEV